MTVDPTGNRAVPEFDFSVDAQVQCDSGQTEYEVRTPADEPIADGVLEVDVEGNPLTGTFRVPGLAAGSYQFVIDCWSGEVVLRGDFDFARYTVAKAVDGQAPDGAVFVIDVDCDGSASESSETFGVPLEFGPDGGSSP